MSDPGRNEDRFFGAALIAVGALIFGLSGLCTLMFAGSTIAAAFRNPTTAPDMIGSLVMYGLIGGFPMIGGFVVTRRGWRMFRGPEPCMSENGHPPPKPPPSAPPPG
jgi:hypothetical protein